MTVAELGERMSSAEFAEWMAFNRLEPLPDPWLQTGVIAAILANQWRDRKSKPLEPADFIPRPRKARGPRLTPAEQSALFAGLATQGREG